MLGLLPAWVPDSVNDKLSAADAAAGSASAATAVMSPTRARLGRIDT